jgi:hypothetical protein
VTLGTDSKDALKMPNNNKILGKNDNKTKYYTDPSRFIIL